MLRLLRLWLLPLLVALLPLHGWAADGTHAADPAPREHAMWFAAGMDDCADSQGSGPLALVDAAEAAPSGADLAEQLLPASAPLLTSARALGVLPAYAPVRPPRG